MKKEDAVNEIPSEYRPISSWEYFFRNILYSIPVVGLIALIVVSFGKGNVNAKNHAKAYFVALIVQIALIAMIYILLFALVFQYNSQVIY